MVPLQPTIPSFTLAIQPVVKGKTTDTGDEWMCNSRTWVQECGMRILGPEADGDSKIRKYFLIRCHSTVNRRVGMSISATDFTFFMHLWKNSMMTIAYPNLCFQISYT